MGSSLLTSSPVVASVKVRPTPAASGNVAIVGAGPGGLGTAMLLAAKGIKVTIYEAASVVGGRTSRLSLPLDGASAGACENFHFDQGPTFFLMPYVLDEIFAAGGRRLCDYVKLTRLDPMYRLVMGRTGQTPITIDCTQNVEAMCRQISDRINPADGPAFAGFIAENRKKLSAFEPILRKPFASVLDLLDPKLMAALPRLGAGTSVYGDLSKRFTSEYTKLITSFQSKYLGMSPMKCPSLFTILPFIEYEYGVWHPEGGCNALMAAMAKACAEMGVDIRYNSPVERLTFAGKTANGVVVGGKRLAHNHVVINADASWAIKNLIPAELRTGIPGLPTAIGGGGWTDKRLDGMGYSCSTFMLYLGLEGQVSMPHHTIYISERYKDNLADISDRGVLSTDPSLYVCNSAATDSTMAPAGHTALYVLVPTPNMRDGKINWPAATAKLREQALDRVSTLADADVRSMIRSEKVFTPQTWQQQNINFGATFNLAHNLTQMLMLRPQHELAGMHNVWMAGGGTHPGSGLPVIFLSCQIAASKILQRMGVTEANSSFASTPVSLGGSAARPAFAFTRPKTKVAAGV